MDYKIGKVTNFDGYTGDIITNDNKYILLDKNVIEGKIENNQVVVFTPNNIQGINMAFDIMPYELFIKKDKNSLLLKKLNKNYDIINKE